MIPLGLWHCFGHKDEMVDLPTIRKMLDASETELLPINTHGGKLRIGHQVLWESFKDEAEERRLTPCLNINLCTSAKEAFDQAEWAIKKTGITLLKFEVLTPDLKNANDGECLAGALALQDYEVMPLLRSAKAAQQAAEMGCPVIRMMGSPIGTGWGIKGVSRAYVVEAVKTGVPIVLDGGIGNVAHAELALELGCEGFLVNSCLFTEGEPWEKLPAFREAMAVMV